MKPINDVYKLVAVMFGGIVVAGLIFFLISDHSNNYSPQNSNTTKIDSNKLLSSVPVKPVKIDTEVLETQKYSSIPTISLDSQLRAKQAHTNPPINNYSYEGMIGKPWSYYKVIDDKLSEIPNDKTLIPVMKQWDKFILSIRDVDVTSYPDSAGINITNNKGTRHYKLKHAEPQKYLLDNGPSKLLLVTRTPLVCELYFVFGDDAASVSNMNWEMENINR